jgi:transporter family protein
MDPHFFGIMLGGLIPALLFSVSNIGMKTSTTFGMSLPAYLMIVGIAVMLAGAAALFFVPVKFPTIMQSGAAVLVGFSWGIGVFCITYSLQKFDTPLSVLTPLFNMNTLFTVLFALWIFSEWKEVRIPQLLIGSVLIVAGGVLVSKA